MNGAIALISPVVDTGAVDVERTIRRFSKTGWSLCNHFLPEGPPSIETPEDVNACIPGILRVAEEIVGNADAIIINCMCDPGLDELRSAFRRMLILGPGQTSMHFASAMGKKFSILDVLDDAKEDVYAQVHKYGVASSYAGHRALNIPVLELGEDREATLRAMVRHARLAATLDGSDSIILGCTALAEFSDCLLAELQKSEISCSLVEPMQTTISFALSALELGHGVQ